MNLFDLDSRTQDLRDYWITSTPIPHVVIPKFLKQPESVEFPANDWEHWTPLGDSYQSNKFICSDMSLFPAALRSIFCGLASPELLSFLETTSGIKGLIPDPYLTGGGLHLSTGGGVLAHHTDFHIYSRLGLYRRLNLLIYLNNAWDSSQGGQLEICDSNAKGKNIRIDPSMNNAVLFETNDRSVHGFATPVAAGCVRRSLAVYYYTARDTLQFSGDQTTYWRNHGRQNTRKKLRLYTYFLLLRISRGFSLVAQVINPNQGMGLLRARLRSRFK